MAPTTTSVEEVIAKTECIEIDPKIITKSESEQENDGSDKIEIKNEKPELEGKSRSEEEEEEEVIKGFEVEPKTGVSFPTKLEDGKILNSLGLRKKAMLGLGINIYAFGLYADNEELKDVLKSKIGKSPERVTKEIYQLAIDDDFPMSIRMVIVYSKLTMSMVRKSFGEGLGTSLKKLTGGKKNDDLSNKVMGQASDGVKLTCGSVIEISRSPGYLLETKVMGETVSKVESELLCRAFVNMYLGDDPFDKEAKEKFGTSLLSLF